jgi:hypothetical protein
MNKTMADEFEDLNLFELFNLKMHIYLVLLNHLKIKMQHYMKAIIIIT